MNNDLVSIVIPVYNMASSIESCVKSLSEQSYKNIEILLIDDGSTDDSLNRCKVLREQDSRIKIFHTENRGAGPARNTGIECAEGRYIYFPDADDKLGENAISILVKAMENGKYDLVVFGYKSINVAGKIENLKVYPEMRKVAAEIRMDYSDYMGATRRYGIQGAPWNKFFDLSVVKKNGIRYPNLRRHQDEGFISSYMEKSQNVHFISDVLYFHYLNDLKKEWDKYPVDYMDSVIGLYKTRESTILTWNKEDKETREIVQKEYICNAIKALEMSYSPKMRLNVFERKMWVKKQIYKSKISKMTVPESLGSYQKIVLKCIKKNHMTLALFIMRAKIEVEKRGFLSKLRRMQCKY